MTNEIFNALTPQQLYEGFVYCRKSAEAHRQCARLMADKGVYGIANSHLILGAEEAIKAIIISFKMNNDPFQIQNVRPFFHEHKAKHKQGLMLMLKAVENKSAISVMVMLKNALTVITKTATVSDSIRNVSPLLRPFDNLDKWWHNANFQKNEGFYVNYDQDIWKSPMNICREHYRESETHTTYLFEILDLSRYAHKELEAHYKENSSM